MEMKNIIAVLAVLTLVGCSNAKYTMRDSTTTRVTDAGARYGSILAAGAAGAYGGYLVNKSPAAAVAGGVGAAGLMYAFNKFGDGRKQAAYDSGVEDGANAVRAQILNDVWVRDAVYGDGKSTGASKKGSPPFKRRVYVPTRTVNGVLMQGGYQEVDYYP